MTHSFEQRLNEQRVLLVPGVYDALSALIAEQAGFEALYLSGASIAYTRLGRSDIGDRTDCLRLGLRHNRLRGNLGCLRFGNGSLCRRELLLSLVEKLAIHGAASR